MKDDFENLGIILPNTFNIPGNKNYKRTGGYIAYNLPPDFIKQHSDILERLNVSEVIVRLSQTTKGKTHIFFTYEINIKFNGH